MIKIHTHRNGTGNVIFEPDIVAHIKQGGKIRVDIGSTSDQMSIIQSEFEKFSDLPMQVFQSVCVLTSAGDLIQTRHYCGVAEEGVTYVLTFARECADAEIRRFAPFDEINNLLFGVLH
jgi:hypothetical protein